jgi:hypothetical protein
MTSEEACTTRPTAEISLLAKETSNMAVTKYFENGSEFWQVYVNIRSAVIPAIRLQKRIRGILTIKAALSEEKRLLAELTRQITKLEARGETWEQLIDRWEQAKLTFKIGDYADTTIIDYAQMLRNWTKIWFGMPASELTRGDGREVLRLHRLPNRRSSFRVIIVRPSS